MFPPQKLDNYINVVLEWPQIFFFGTEISIQSCKKSRSTNHMTLFHFWQKSEENPRFYCNECGAFCSFNFVESVEQDVNIHMQKDNPPLVQVSMGNTIGVIHKPWSDGRGMGVRQITT